MNAVQDLQENFEFQPFLILSTSFLLLLILLIHYPQKLHRKQHWML